MGHHPPPQRRHHTLTAFKSIRAARPDGAPIYVICDNWSGNRTLAIRAWAARNKVKLCFTPTIRPWPAPYMTT